MITAHDLYRNIAMAVTSEDSDCIANWLHVALMQDRMAETMRCEAYWDTATEAEQAHIGAHLGWIETWDGMGTVPAAIVRDFEALALRASWLLSN